ncbi:MAG: protein kinase [Deltaproteobacteria bacterium]|nr:protein kinase [Deltaproteobacteria bacterium]
MGPYRKTIDQPGALVGGRYHLVELAGVGSMAEVWRAEHQGPGGFRRTVALKRMASRLEHLAQYRALFMREARVHAALDHPNVVQVVDFGEDPSGLYLVTEWVEGLTLRAISELCGAFGVRTSPLLMAAVCIEVLRALEAAHTHTERVDGGGGSLVPATIIHRDVSPTNVLLSVRGVVKLADFGIARALEDPRSTPAEAFLGKASYVAPEVVLGEPFSVQTDLYACGAMLWEAVAHQRLWGPLSDNEIVVAMAQRVRPQPLLAVRPDVPAALAQVMDLAVSTRPQDRFPTAATFARALSDVLRMMPERTDTTRLAQEVQNALNLKLQRDAAVTQARARKVSGAQPSALALPATLDVVAQAQVDDPRPTMELVGAFPESPVEAQKRARTPAGTPAVKGTASQGAPGRAPPSRLRSPTVKGAAPTVPVAPPAEAAPEEDPRPSVELTLAEADSDVLLSELDDTEVSQRGPGRS